MIRGGSLARHLPLPRDPRLLEQIQVNLLRHDVCIVHGRADAVFLIDHESLEFDFLVRQSIVDFFDEYRVLACVVINTTNIFRHSNMDVFAR